MVSIYHKIFFSCIKHNSVYFCMHYKQSEYAILSCLSYIIHHNEVKKYTMKVLLSVGTNFCGLGKKYKFIDSWISGFDKSILQMNWTFTFSWEPGFVVYKIHKNHENWYPTINDTFTVVNCLVIAAIFSFLFHYSKYMI